MPTTRRRTRWPWLVATALLLGLAGWLMLGAEPPPRPPPPAVSLPQRMTLAERTRGEARQTWLPPASPDAGAPPAPARPRDPVMALMPPTVKRAAVVAEVSAIVHSELGGLLMDCLFAGDPEALSALRDGGFDPTTKVDRMALIDDALVITGDLRGAALDSLLPPGASRRGHGRRGELLEWSRPDGGLAVVGVWDSQLLVAGAGETGTKALLDRLESSGPPTSGVLTEDDAWGEVYGAVSADAVADLLARQDDGLAQTVRDSAKGLTMHLDVSHDLGLVGDVEVNDAAKGNDLRKALGSALALARMQAQARGAHDEATLLDLAKVRGLEDGTFHLEAGIPHAYLKASLERCVVEQRGRRERRAPDGGP